MKQSVTAALIAFSIGAAVSLSSQGTDPLRERARRLHKEIIVLDTHADMSPFFQKDTMPPQITDPGMAGPAYDPSTDPAKRPVIDNWTKTFPPGPWRFDERHEDGYMDLPRMREGGLDAEFISIYMEEEPRPGMAITRALGQVDSVHAIAEKYPSDVAVATTAAEVRQIVASNRIALLMGMEGAYMFEDDIRVMRMFHRLGVRYVTLTHSFNTNWADSAGTGKPVPPRHDGLSPFGREVVKEMNRIGMIVDVTHVSDDTFWDALEVTETPVILSHSSVDAVREHARNISDDMLRALARNGGVLQVTAVTKYVDPQNRPDAPLSLFIDHIEHAIKVAGPDHVGIGIDYGYSAPRLVGLEDCSKFENITYELLKRGHSEEVIRKVWGENTLRVMAEVERYAARATRLGGASAGAEEHPDDQAD